MTVEEKTNNKFETIVMSWWDSLPEEKMQEELRNFYEKREMNNDS